MATRYGCAYGPLEHPSLHLNPSLTRFTDVIGLVDEPDLAKDACVSSALS